MKFWVLGLGVVLAGCGGKSRLPEKHLIGVREDDHLAVYQLPLEDSAALLDVVFCPRGDRFCYLSSGGQSGQRLRVISATERSFEVRKLPIPEPRQGDYYACEWATDTAECLAPIISDMHTETPSRQDA